MIDVKEAPAGAGAVGATDGHNGERAVSLDARPGNERRSKPKAVVHLTVAERAEKGKAARLAAPRAELGDWQPAADRRDPVELLEEQAASRLRELVPIRYGRMLVSPFTFFRGAAYPMAADLAGAPRTGLDVQLCGDAHLSNFGAFGAPDRRLVFSINDFDETLPGPFEWDVKRLVASFAVAGRDRGFDAKQRRSINRDVSKAYREAIREFAGMSNLDLWYSRIDVDEIDAAVAQHGSGKQRKRFEANVAKARSKDSLRAFTKLTTTVDGEPRIASDPPLIVPIDEVAAGAEEFDHAEFVRGVIRSYRRTLTPDRRELLERFRYVHAARKVVGVGSVGARAWIVLMLGRDDHDPLFLQVKEAQASVLEPFVGKSKFNHHGQRVVEGQRLTQAAGDIMLGWIRVADLEGVNRDFYIRQLWDGKGSALVDLMEPTAMTIYARLCGHALAKAHARSGDAIAIASYLGGSDSFDRALATFAETYADQNERDYSALQEAVASGRIAAETGL
ncbi:DUF2252 domain-containing protein [Solirubrobacter ginsenosidimutans]|uniref:DUF2252 domain-containing protein n=1 Tax=Solirubrobacter ginsenosidimutans TaxID=490573 RepID=A0A9X3S1Q7_9ACTN|nr:DUF2252 domain-containing protein [Solirubrobacter ginsenosidimutans]MDA0161387.1 DUF2252 domain-containing protein [Solirubrobacter ginsenosidimutans]